MCWVEHSGSSIGADYRTKRFQITALGDHRRIVTENWSHPNKSRFESETNWPWTNRYKKANQKDSQELVKLA